MAYNTLIASLGGPGHLGQTLTAASKLRRRGHGVRFISRPDARTEVEAAGFGFVTWQRTPSFSPIAEDRDGLRYAYVEAATDQFIAVMNEWLPMLNDARA